MDAESGFLRDGTALFILNEVFKAFYKKGVDPSWVLDAMK
jgi:hypothetical protein